MNSNIIQCPICQDYSKCKPEGHHKVKRYICESCGLAFVENLQLSVPPETLYEDAYQGNIGEARMTDYYQRLHLRKMQKSSQVRPEKLQTWPTLSITLDWLRQNIPPGSTVLHIGCGTGVFMELLKENGFNPVGLDVAKSVVDLLTDLGYEVWHGTVDNIPDNWHQPAAILCFFLLQHLSDPMAFFQTLRSKFPASTVLISQYIYRDPVLHRIDPGFPPRHLTEWSQKSLAKAMEKAGYKVSLTVPPSGSLEFDLPRILLPVLVNIRQTSVAKTLLRLYYTIKPYILWPRSIWIRIKRTPSSAMLAIGEPPR